jgi:selenium-binding protein 1
MVKLDVGGGGGIAFDERFFLDSREVFGGRRVHQVRLEGGDASSDSYCYSD